MTAAIPIVMVATTQDAETGSAPGRLTRGQETAAAGPAEPEAATADPCREARLTRRCTPPPSADLDEADEEKKRRSDEDDALTLGLVTGMSVGGFGIAG